MKHIVLLLLLLIQAPPFQTAAAQDAVPTLPGFAPANDLPAATVSWRVAPEPGTARAGEWLALRFTLAIEPGWKMYAMDSPAGKPLAVHLDSLPQAFSLDALRQAAPKEGYDPNFDADVRYFEREAVVVAGLRVAVDTAPGTYRLGGRMTYMTCNDNLCLPPKTEPFEATVVVEPGAPREAFTGPRWDTLSPVGRTKPPAQQTAGGLWSFLLLAVGAGLVTLLTPCVFPMIPLTVSFFTRHAGDRRAAVRMAGVYGGAIVLTFTSLGLVMALLVGAAGAQTIAANPWVNLFIGFVFVAFALSLLGLFELRVPGKLLNFFNRQSNERQGYAGVVFMGLTLTLVSFSCTAPFVGGLLAAAAAGTWVYPLVGMVAFSATFALPFVVFALFPKALGALPKSGAWMNTVKVTLGFVELAAALKFLSNADLVWGWGLLSRPLAVALAAVVFALAGLYLIGKLRMAHEPPVEAVGPGRLMAAVAFFGLALYLLPGLFGAPLGRLDAYLPPRQATDAGQLATASLGTAADEHAWHVDDLEAALAVARSTGKPVFVDFTGYTCTNCREMEARVFPAPEVARRFRENFVLLRLYTDAADTGARWQRYQLDLTGTVAMPTYAILTPDERLLAQWSGMASVPAFTSFLDAGRASSPSL